MKPRGFSYIAVVRERGEKGVNLRVNGQYVPNEPSRMLTLSTYINQRPSSLPWSNEPPPDWTTRVRALHYAGQVGAVVPGSPNIPLPLSLTLRVVARGRDWVRFAASQSAGGAGGALPIREEYEWMAGPNQLCGPWIAPNGLTALRAGQELDRDTVTGFTTTVARVGPGPNGKEVVMISRIGQGQQLDFGYDKSTGMLVYIDRRDRGTAGIMRATLSIRGTE